MEDTARARTLAPAEGAAVRATLELGPEPRRVRQARHFATRQLLRWRLGHIAQDAEIIVSELVTNGMLHGRSRLSLTLLTNGHRLRIEVRDDDDRLPVLTGVGEGAIGGRGLVVVEALAADWGVAHTAIGKCVWAELACHG